MNKTNFCNILFNSDHFLHPLSFNQEVAQGIYKKEQINTPAKVASIAAAVFLTVATLGLGLPLAVIILYMSTAVAKYRTQSKTDHKVTVVHLKYRRNPLPRVVDAPPPILPPILPPIPETAIKIGLKNFDSTTCWMNALIKFLASHTDYDALFTITDEEIDALVRENNSIPDPEKQAKIELLKDLREHFIFIITTLRTPTAETEQTFLDPKYLASLRSLLHQLAPRNGFNRRQSDPREALNTIENYLKKDPSLTLNMDNLNENPILIWDENHNMNVTMDGMLIAVANEHNLQGINIETALTNQLANSPDQICLQIARNYGRAAPVAPRQAAHVKKNTTRANNARPQAKRPQAKRPQAKRPQAKRPQAKRWQTKLSQTSRIKPPVYRTYKSAADINLDADFSITLPILDQAGQQVRRERYCVTSAILHSGGPTSGHYVTVEKKTIFENDQQKDIYLYHNDKAVTEITEARALSLFKKSTILNFERVDDENLNVD